MVLNARIRSQGKGEKTLTLTFCHLWSKLLLKYNLLMTSCNATFLVINAYHFHRILSDNFLSRETRPASFVSCKRQRSVALIRLEVFFMQVVLYSQMRFIVGVVTGGVGFSDCVEDKIGELNLRKFRPPKLCSHKRLLWYVVHYYLSLDSQNLAGHSGNGANTCKKVNPSVMKNYVCYMRSKVLQSTDIG